MNVNVFDLELLLYYCLPLFSSGCALCLKTSPVISKFSRIDHPYSLSLFIVVKVSC